MESFLVAVNAVMPFLIYISFGYGVRMSGRGDEAFMNKLNKLIFRAFFPILMFNNLYKVEPGFTLDGRLVAVGVGSVLLLELILVFLVPKFVKGNPQKWIDKQTVDCTVSYYQNCLILAF